MKIRIRSQRSCLQILLPTGLFLNKWGVSLLFKHLKGKEFSITPEQAKLLFQAIRSCKKRFKHWKLMEAESADGDFFEIIL